MNYVRILTNSCPLIYKVVPFSEIPRGFRGVHIKGVGEVYADPAEFGIEIPDFRHPEFPEEIREIFRESRKDFK
jgi:hypothetical protein